MEGSRWTRSEEQLIARCQQLEQSLEEANERYRLLQQTVPQGIVEIDLKARILFANQVVHSIFGYPEPELREKTIFDLCPEAERQKLRRQFEELFLEHSLSHTSSVPFAGQGLSKSGDTIEIRAVWDYTRDSAGVVCGAVAVVSDVTREVERERELQAARESYRLVTDSIPLHIAAIDRSGYYFFWNPYSKKMLGYDEEEVIGKLSPATFHRTPQEAAEVLQCARRDGIYDRETVLVHRDGTEIPAHLVVVPRRVDGEITELFGFAEDITERQRARLETERLAAIRQALASKVLEAQEQERLRLARELHDDVGQMLAVIKMEGAWIERHCDQPREAYRTARKLCEKVDETLAVVRGLSHSLRPAAIDDLGVGDALETLAQEISRHSSIRCVTRCADASNLPRDVATAIYRIAQEALANVVRHSRGTQAWVTFEDTESVVALTIEDNGCGLQNYHAESPSSVGIASMRERAALLGGELRISPREGGGTTIAARIPYRSPT